MLLIDVYLIFSAKLHRPVIPPVLW